MSTPQRDRFARPLVGVVALAGLAVYAYAFSNLPAEQLGEVALFFVLAAAAQRMPVPLFRNSAISVAFPITFAALVYLGPAAAVAVNLGSALVTCVTPRRKPAEKMAFNLGLMALSGGAGAVLYAVTGGAFAPTHLDWGLLPPALVGTLGAFLVQSGLTALVIARTTRSSFAAVWDTNYRWLAPHYAALGLVGLGMAAAAASAGLPALGAFLLPLAMAWYSFKLYMAKTAEVRTRNDALSLANAQLDVANARLRQRVTELDALGRTGLSLTAALDLGAALGQAAEAACQLLPAASAAVALTDATGLATLAASVGLEQGSAEGLRAAAQTALAGQGVHATRAGGRAVWAAPLVAGTETIGALVVAFSADAPGEDAKALLGALAQQTAAAVQAARLRQELERQQLAAVHAMAAVVDAREGHAPGHAERVRAYAAAAGQRMGLGAKELAALELAALFHDLGHVGVPEQVLAKPGALSVDEQALLRRHPELGVAILRQVPGFEPVARIVLEHHERYDGQGYPAGLLGADASPLAQILAVADAYEAMTAARPHRAALPRTAAIAQLKAHRGSQFAPAAVDALIAATADTVPAPAKADPLRLRLLLNDAAV